MALALCASSPSTVYACFAGSSTNLAGLWRTDNAWNSSPAWTKLPDPISAVRQELGQLDYGLALAVDPANPNIVYFGEIGVWKYNGNGWTTLAGHYDEQVNGVKIHPDQHAMGWAGNRLIVCNDGGVWSSTDAGNSFLSHNTSLSTIQFYHGSIHPVNPNVALGGEQDNGSAMWFGANGWKMVGFGDGCDNAISWQHPNDKWLISYPQLGIVRVTGAGQFQTTLTGQQQDALFVAPFAICPGNENIVVAGASRLWRSDGIFNTDSPEWAANTPQLVIQSYPIRISALAFAPSDNTGNTYAFGTIYGQVLVTGQGGSQGDDWSNWYEPDAMIPGRYVTAVAFDPANGNVLYVTLSGFDEATPDHPGHVFRTRTALSDNATWDNISPPVNIPHNCLAIDPKKPNTIYVGTDLGVWQTVDGGANWTHMGPESGMPNVAVYDIEVHPQTERVFAFTHGRGAFIFDPNAANIPPAIASFSPTNGPAGTTVTIRGTKFDGATAVQFNGVNAAGFSVNAGTNISATVPAGATTGPIKVTTPTGSATSANNFAVLNNPAILSFTPNSGNVGTIVTLTGVNFTGASSIAFGGANAPGFTIDSSTQATATVPSGATTGRITLTTPSGTATSPDVFTVSTTPVISGFTPTAAGIGTQVVITGANFTGATSVKFNGVAATFTVNTAGQITATVPAGAISGPLQVATPSGTTTSADLFTVIPAPSISGLSPASGAGGTKVTVKGSNFAGATTVRFNGAVASGFSVDSASQITATAPEDVSTGPAQVETPGGTAVSSSPFTVLPPPGNDNFSNAQSISGDSGTISGSNVPATKEPGEPNHAGNEGGKSIWYRWIATGNGYRSFSTQGSPFDTLLAVYTGNAVANLTEVASSDNSTGNEWSRVTFYANAGTTYWIAIDGFRDEEAELQHDTFADSGAATLSWQAAAALPPTITGFSPGYGPIGSAVVISGSEFLGATGVSFPGANASFHVDSATQITATVPDSATTGPLKVTTPGGVATSLDSFAVKAPPSNDNFANAATLDGLSGIAVGNNSGATQQPGEPNHAGGVGGKSIWYVWNAPTNGTWRFDTRGSSLDTLLGIYTGSSPSSLSVVASNDNSGGLLTSEAILNGIAGTSYRIAVDGKNGAEGNVKLTWTYINTAPAITGFSPNTGGPATQVTITGSNLLSVIAVGFNGVNTADFTVDSSTQVRATVPPSATTGPLNVTTRSGSAQAPGVFTVVEGVASNDSFANRTLISGDTLSVPGSNANCTREFNEPFHAGDAGGRSVWWSWTAPRNGVFKITTTGSDFDSLLGIYTGNGMPGLTQIDSNDDDWLIYPASSVEIDAVAGTAYQIAVDGYGGAAGKILLSIFPVTPAQYIYYTGFEPLEGYSSFFTLAGQNGWHSFGSGDNGLLFDYFGDFSYQAYVGDFSASPGDTLYLWQPLNYTPQTSTLPVVNFAAYVEIFDSFNGFYDDFDWDVYNQNGDRLFLLNFDNYNMRIYCRLNDSDQYHDTGFTFDNYTIYDLELMMDFGRNRWTAYLDGQPIVTEQPISATSVPLNLGDIDARWNQRNGWYGDNAMLFDDYLVWADISPVPRMVVQPKSQSVPAGSNVQFSALADSSAEVFYQWQFNGASIPGATSPVLDLGAVNFGNAGAYQVVVSNLTGVATSQVATLAVTQLPNLVPYKQATWSDKIVITTSAQSTTDTPLLHDTDELYLSWAVLNSDPGANIGEKFYTGVFLDNVLVETWWSDGLDLGNYAFVTGYDLGKLSAGQHSVRIRADLTSVVLERDKNDNEYARNFMVTGTQPVTPVITGAGLLQGTNFAFTVVATLAQQYQVLTSTNLSSWTTNSTLTIVNPDGAYRFVAPIDRSQKARFFRLRLVSP